MKNQIKLNSFILIGGISLILGIIISYFFLPDPYLEVLTNDKFESFQEYTHSFLVSFYTPLLTTIYLFVCFTTLCLLYYKLTWKKFKAALIVLIVGLVYGIVIYSINDFSSKVYFSPVYFLTIPFLNRL